MSIIIKLISGTMLSVAKAFLTERIITMVVLEVMKALAASTKTQIDDRIVAEVAASLGSVNMSEIKEKIQ